MRIVLTSNFSPWSSYSGGGQRSTHQLASALVGLGHDVTVVYTAPLGRAPQPTEETLYDIRWAAFFGLRGRRSSPLRPLNALSVRSVVERIHQEAPIQVVHSQGEEGALLGPWSERSGVAFVMTPRYPSYPSVLHPEMTRSDRVWIWALHAKYLVLEKALLGAQMICPTSEVTREAIHQAFGLEDKTFRVVPNGIHEGFLQGNWRGDVDGDVLFFGRLARDKGGDLFLRAMATLPGTLCMVGRGDEEDTLKDLARTLGMEDRIRWVSWMSPEELRDALEEASLVVLPSRHESFGNAMAEALAVGAPLVTTRAGSIPGVVGEGALLAPSDDPDGLREQILWAMEHRDEMAAMAQRGKVDMAARFRWKSVGETYVQVYEECINELTSRRP